MQKSCLEWKGREKERRMDDDDCCVVTAFSLVTDAISPCSARITADGGNQTRFPVAMSHGKTVFVVVDKTASHLEMSTA